ncbi:putative minor capsid protein [Streptococcus suis]
MIDKRTLVDSVSISKPIGKDQWGNVEFDIPLFLSPVKFDRNYENTGSGNRRSESKPSVVLVYPQFCPVELDRTFLGGKVTCDGIDYIVQKLIPQYHPFQKKILCYEVEVI